MRSGAIPPLSINQNLLESHPLKSKFLVRRLAVPPICKESRASTQAGPLLRGASSPPRTEGDAPEFLTPTALPTLRRMAEKGRVRGKQNMTHRHAEEG